MMVRIQIDGNSYDVKPGKNLLETCLSLGIYVPHFCYHSALGSVGACRLCAVKKYRNTDDQTGKIVMSCMEPVADGLIINVNDAEAVAFRKAVIEGLMTNHPHDCPVCDEGGECHLQDMTVMTGHAYRRFNYRKRTYRNQDLGPFINHEMNRCIQCYRCVRYYADYAGGEDFGVFGAHDSVYFGRHEDGPLESEFSGNLVEVCPTGVFTDKTLKEHYTRKWDLTNSPSVCVHCSLGCNTIAGERYGSLRRIMSRYNGSVNGYFICDRGRFGYEFVNNEDRITSTKVNAERLGDFKDNHDDISTIFPSLFSDHKDWVGIGSPRASLEANYLLSKLTGKDNFYHGVSARDHLLIGTVIEIMQSGNAAIASLKDIEKADAILILGEDVTNTAPMAALAIRQAVLNAEKEVAAKAGIPVWNDSARREKGQGKKSPLYIASSIRTKLDDIATDKLHAGPDDIARLGFAIAGHLRKNTFQTREPVSPADPLEIKIARALKNSSRPLILAGTHPGSLEIIKAAGNILSSLATSEKKPLVFFIVPECNSMGLGMMPGGSFETILKNDTAPKKKSTGLIILENDLYRRGSEDMVNSLTDMFNPVIVLDHSVSRTTIRAEVVLPAGSFAESDGTLVNNEGRAQRYYRVFPPGGTITESWRLLLNLINLRYGNQGNLEEFEDVIKAMAGEVKAFEGILKLDPAPDHLMLNEKVRRQTMRFSGRTAIRAGIAVSEIAPPEDTGSPLAFTMEGGDEIPPSSLTPFYWVPGWNSIQALNFYLDEANGSLKGGDPGVRLILPSEENKMPYNNPSGEPKNYSKGSLTLVPVYRIFGSEELSSRSGPVKERSGSPFILMNTSDAKEAGLKFGDQVTAESGGQKMEAVLINNESIPNGLAAVSMGFTKMPFMELPGNGKLSTKEHKEG